MKKSKLERGISIAVIGACVVKAVLYGGSKPSVTNAPPDDVSSPTNGVSQNANPRESGESPRMMLRRFASIRPIGEDSRSSTLTNWTARGAFCDWTRVEFPEGWRFPSGTGFVDAVTLFAWGSIRESLRCTTTTSDYDLVSLPAPLSVEPGVSSVSHGLTPSNSYLFAWTDCCAERDATNRIDASIELFRSGEMAVTVRSSNALPTTIYQLPTPPRGFFGRGQDAEWASTNFPDAAGAIAAKGYDAWLLEDCVGINEQNGLYRALVTVTEMPPDGEPCYLECGPYKVVVTHPGTYGFPLEVFETYRVRTYPTAVPLEIETDDGYRGVPDGPGSDWPPPLMLGAPPAPSPNEYTVREEPRLVISPRIVPLNTAVGTHVSIWCNLTNATRRFVASVSREFYLVFGFPTDAEIVEALIEDAVEIIVESRKGSCSGWLEIRNPPPPPRPPCIFGRDCLCPQDCVCNGGTNACYCSCFACTNGVGAVTNRYCTGDAP